MPYQPLDEILRDVLYSIKIRSFKEKEVIFDPFAWDLTDVYPQIASYPFMKTIDKLPEKPDNDKSRLFAAITTSIRRITANPLILFLDDLQWATEDVWRWIIYANRNLKNTPNMIIGAYTQNNDLINYEKHINDAQKDGAVFVCIDHKKEKFSMEEKSENPLWEQFKNLSVEEQPKMNSVKKTLMVASVIGEQFDYEILKNILSDEINEKELKNNLIFANQKGFVSDMRDGTFKFNPDLPIKKVQQEMFYPDIQKYHKKIAEALEKLDTDNQELVLEQIAEHYLKAGRKCHKKGVEYGKKAVTHAKNMYAYNHALYNLDNLINAATPTEEIDFLLQKAEILEKIGKSDQALVIYFSLEERLEYQQKDERLLKIYTRIQHVLLTSEKNWTDAATYLKKAKKLADKIDNKRLLADTYKHWGIYHEKKREYSDSITAYEKALNIYEELNLKEEQGYVWNNIGNSYRNRGFSQKDLSISQKAVEPHQKALKIAEEVDNLPEIAKIHSNLGLLFQDFIELEGETPEDPIPHLKEAYKILKKIGFKRDLMGCIGNLFDSYTFIGKFDKAEEYFNEYSQLAYELGLIHESGIKRDIANSLVQLADGYLVNERYEKSKKFATQALEKYQEIVEDYDVSRKQYEAKIIKDRSNALLLKNSADKAYEAEDYEKALRDYQKAKKLFLPYKVIDKVIDKEVAKEIEKEVEKNLEEIETAIADITTRQK
jgi:tetratricopeptide (TPR) repeat protein